MDSMNMDGTTVSGMMKPYLHFTLGDMLWLGEWRPTSPGTLFSACLGLFFLSIIERLLSAMKGIMDAWWKHKAEATRKRNIPQSDTGSSLNCCEADEKNVLTDTEAALARPSSASTSIVAARVPIHRILPPFILSHDLTRAAFATARSAVQYSLMLAVMTFNVSFILSILAGVFIGELLFGRFAGTDAHQ
ncbi:hypothetical protein FRB97_006930 [Tulasnella sp. 331]|nr:hypothetical protein FRB97_006930 [Tulasnella sp. 331]KAG8876945.1 hypothetical protein FRB98_006956 [Tulasnella sp. 332]